MTVVMAEQMEGYGPPAPVPIFQWEAEFAQLLDEYRRRGPKRVLEVGTYHGGTLYHWLQNAQPGTLVVSIDNYAVGIDNRDLYPDWIPDGVDLRVVKGDTHDPMTFVRAVAHCALFDWAFIDAGHYYSEVKNDWETFGPRVVPGGVVVFHDILPPSRQHPEIEVSRLWDEIKKTHETREIVADWGASWGGIGLVFI